MLKAKERSAVQKQTRIVCVCEICRLYSSDNGVIKEKALSLKWENVKTKCNLSH